jgi:SAM-dependent methyltransferase
MRSDLYEHSYHHLGDSESRQSLLLKYLNREQLGIEIAPWHSPLVPKKEGYQVQVLDILSTSALIERCRKDPACAEKIGNIEDVDIIASAIEIGDVIKARGQENTYDYIVSSHNFEHLSDPIYFLKGCGNVLRAGGLLSMAIPDKKYTFDYFRTLSSTADFLRAYYLKQNAPTPFQIFDFSSKLVK